MSIYSYSIPTELYPNNDKESKKIKRSTDEYFERYTKRHKQHAKRIKRYRKKRLNYLKRVK